MKIGIYIGSLDPLKGGESTLTRRIIKEIMGLDRQSYDFVFLYYKKGITSYEHYINNYKLINISNCCGPKNWIINGLVESIGGGSNRFFKLDRIAEKENIDMFYFAAPIFAQTSLPYIFTVWDLGHRTVSYFPEVSGLEWGYREKMYQHMLPRATYIITGNEQGKNEILKYYNVDDERIVVCGFPVTIDDELVESKPDFYDGDLFFFYPAQFWPHKNHICILEALVILRNKYSLTPKVYFTGGDKGNRVYIQNKIHELNLEKQVFITGYVKDEELKYLYTHAKALVFASLMGPNNLPPIEATYLKCPVIISDIPGHKEQMGDSALYFDGYNPEDLADKIHTFLNDNIIASKLIYSKDANKVISVDNYFANILKLFKNIDRIISRWK